MIIWLLGTILVCHAIQLYFGFSCFFDSKRMKKRFDEWFNNRDQN